MIEILPAGRQDGMMMNDLYDPLNSFDFFDPCDRHFCPDCRSDLIGLKKKNNFGYQIKMIPKPIKNPIP